MKSRCSCLDHHDTLDTLDDQIPNDPDARSVRRDATGTRKENRWRESSRETLAPLHRVLRGADWALRAGAASTPAGPSVSSDSWQRYDSSFWNDRGAFDLDLGSAIEQAGDDDHRHRGIVVGK